MTQAFKLLFWLGIFWLGYVYIGYPTLLWLIGLVHRFRAAPSEGYLPKVSVLLSARNEQKDIGWKIAETLAWDYPREQLELLVASDASEDGTDEILKNVADPRFRYLRLEPRRGKNEALNQLKELARGELLFFSDANSHIEPSCLQRVVRHFSDPRVGCVTGSERTIGEDEFVMKTGTKAFLGYESLVNTLEGRLGSVLVCDGSIFCIRRSLFTELQPDLANDLELPIHIGAAGHAILFDPLATSFEKATSSPIEEFHRKQRICAQGILGFWRLRQRLGKLRAWQFFSRKLLRWFGAIALGLIFVSNLFLLPNPFYTTVLVLQVAFYGLALLGWRSAVRGRQGSRAITLPFYFVMVNVAALTGILKGISGRRFSVWESPAHSRGTHAESPRVGDASDTSETAPLATEDTAHPASRRYGAEIPSGKCSS